MGLWLLVIASLLSLAPAEALPARAERCFSVPGITNCITDRFQEYWDLNGGLPVFGYPISRADTRQTGDQSYLTQLFERNRFELHPELAAPYDVLLGRLGDERLTQLGRDWRSAPKGQQTNECLWFSQTGHSVCDQEPGVGFRSFWSSNGLRDPKLNDYGRSLALFGLPLTEPAMERNAAGDTVLTQWFERARFEYHPGNPREFKVLLGLLGNEVVGPGAAPPPAPAPPPAGQFNPNSFTLELQEVSGGLDRPTHVTNARDGSGRLFVVEKAGRIRIVAEGALRAQPFLDIANLVGSGGGEQGLFSVAFHPRYRENGQLYVNYTNKAGDTVVARYRVSSNPNVADAGSAATILTVDQPAANHNGGQIAFGRDGYLYIGMGDGGGSGDPWGSGQNRGTLLGKMLRIDVDGGAPYAIPRDNPFVGQSGTRPEIWALGLRNPWRFTVDRSTGDLWIGDVGQNEIEEIDLQPAGRGGLNYGWSVLEGTRCFKPAADCSRSGFEMPINEYSQDVGGCSVVAGYRYRGQAAPAFGDAFFFADYCSGRVWGLAPGGGGWARHELLDTSPGISSFGEDEQGELFLVNLSRGILYRLVARPR